MPHYATRGKLPHKRHTQFRKPDGSLYSEELVSTEGFSSVYSIIYHAHAPTAVLKIDEPIDVSPKVAVKKNMQHRCYLGFGIKPQDDFLKSRMPVLVNNDCHIVLAAPKKSMKSYFYKNSDACELIFVHEGTGTLRSLFGELRFSYGDYINVPRGTIYQIEFDTDKNRLFIVESFSPIVYPKKYRNAFGQLLENSPFCERDIRAPENLQTIDEKGDYLIYIKKEGNLWPYHSLESDWFRRSGKSMSSGSRPGTGPQPVVAAAQTASTWTSPADDGWRAAQAVAAPAAGETTNAGLPKRVPRANLVPGSVGGGGGQDAGAAVSTAPARTAEDIRSRMSSFQRGVREGRAAAPQIEEQ